MVYGSFVVLDVQWLAAVVKPLCSHKDMSKGEVNLGGITVKSGPRLDRLVNKGILEPKLAEELWPSAWKYLLQALSSVGLTFPFPGDKEGGLVVLLRLPTERPRDVGKILDGFRRENHVRIKASCTFVRGMPPGFVERLLSTCCRLGSCKPFWRYGVLIQSGTLFSVILEYLENDDSLVGELTLESFGDPKTAGPWLAMSACLSVLVEMMSQFPGVEVEAKLECLLHNSNAGDQVGFISIDLHQV